jgi:hypothetical protein
MVPKIVGFAILKPFRWRMGVGRRVEKLVAVPRPGRGSGFRLAIPDDAGDDQVRVVQGRAERRRQGVAQLPPLVNYAGVSRIEMARKGIGPGKRFQEPRKARPVEGQVREIFGEGSLQVHVGQVGRRPVPRPRDEQDVGVRVEDEPVEMGVHQIDPRRRPPMTQETVLDVHRF